MNPVNRRQQGDVARSHRLLDGQGGKITPEVPARAPGVLAMFEEHTARAPGASAVVSGGKILSYGWLRAQQELLALRLHACGVGPETLVGIFLDRRPEMVVGTLAVLRAGAAFVLLDPAHPRERLRLMGDQIRSPVVLTLRRLLSSLPFAPGSVICVDDEPEGRIAEISRRGPELGDAAAYAVFTSGSTGQPKGAVLPRRGLDNLIRASRRLFGIGPDDRVLQFASPGFDVAVWEICLSLASGAALHLTGEEGPELDDLPRRLRAERITAVMLPPSVMSLVSPEGLPDLRLVVSVGEACTADIVRRWASGRRFFNGYGPAEISVTASAWEARPQDPGPPPIGYPLDNVRIHILDSAKNAVPAGSVGEVYIGGEGVGRGYLGRPDLTAERFVPDPFAGPGQEGSRLYRSGDLGRFLSGGALQFHGRVDHQIKIRGTRVEPGEVEAALRAHTGVRGAVVGVRESPSGEPSLVAWVLPASGLPPAAELRQFLRRTLPDAMIPSLFVPLSRLPLTPTGKLDRSSLPAPVPPPERHAPPRGPLERELVGIWEEILGQRVGARDDFFDLGGHSVAAVRLAARIGEHFGTRLSAAALLEAPTVEQMAQRLMNCNRRESPLVVIHPRGSRPPLFFVHGADGRVFYYRRLAQHLREDQPFQALDGWTLAGDRLPGSAEEMAARYVAEIQAAWPAGPCRLGGYCMGGTIAFEMARQLVAQGREVDLLVLIDTYDWSRARPGSLRERLGFGIQKVEFLGRNAALLPSGSKGVFLREKARWAAAMARDRWARTFAGHLRVDLNAHCHRLMTLYEPGFFPGRVTLFRSAKTYDRYRGRELCPGVHAQSVDVEELQACHGALLVEPFVRQVAARLQSRLKGLRRLS
jgi:amino acid adenylation domain-containing protein